ncbi:MAG: hypothetical protein J5646_08470 [Bacteroidales bacterium]|nr:hypothetical protein [Bacteroidales bacterium]
MKNKKGIVILSVIAALCLIGFIASRLYSWPVDQNNTEGNVAKSSRFSRKTSEETLTNMEELIQTDSVFRDAMVAAQVVMQARVFQFGTLVEMSNEAAGNIPAFAEVLKDMNATIDMVSNVNKSLMDSGKELNAALEGEECPDLAQKTINASLAYTNLQKQNNLATRFIETTDKYLETAEGDDGLKFVRDQWLEYQRMTAALDGDKATAEALAKKSNLLKGDQVINALALFGPLTSTHIFRAEAILEPMGVPTELRQALGEDRFNEIITVAHQSLTVENKSGKDLNEVVTKGLENQGTLEMSGRGKGSVTLSFPDLGEIPNVISSWQGITQQAGVVSQNQIVKQNTGIGLSLAEGVGEVVRQTAVGQRAKTVGQKASTPQ